MIYCLANCADHSYSHLHHFIIDMNWACREQNQQNDLWAQWRLRWAWAAKDPRFLRADREASDWSDWADAQVILLVLLHSGSDYKRRWIFFPYTSVFIFIILFIVNLCLCFVATSVWCNIGVQFYILLSITIHPNVHPGSQVHYWQTISARVLIFWYTSSFSLILNECFWLLTLTLALEGATLPSAELFFIFFIR